MIFYYFLINPTMFIPEAPFIIFAPARKVFIILVCFFSSSHPVRRQLGSLCTKVKASFFFFSSIIFLLCDCISRILSILTSLFANLIWFRLRASAHIYAYIGLCIFLALILFRVLLKRFSILLSLLLAVNLLCRIDSIWDLVWIICSVF